MEQNKYSGGEPFSEFLDSAQVRPSAGGTSAERAPSGAQNGAAQLPTQGVDNLAQGDAAAEPVQADGQTVGAERCEQTAPLQPILQCRNLTKLYGNAAALTNVSFSVNAGGVVGLLGPNGSGKSTLIKLAMGMLQPTSGEILIDGKKPSPVSKAFTAYLPDANYLCDWMTVDRQVRYCADFFADFNLLKAEGMLSRLGISGRQKIKTLSKGNKEKLGLILTMARDARLYILDEPIAGVDPAARDFILDTVMTNRPEGATIFLCTHLISDIEPILTHALFLNRGAIALDAPVAEVKEKEGKTLDELFREVFRW